VAAGAGAFAEQEEDSASNSGQHEPTAEHAAGLSSSTAHDAAVQRAVATDDAGTSLEPKHDHARDVGHEPSAGNEEKWQREVQQQDEEPRIRRIARPAKPQLPALFY
jgi:hypothetical protein